MFFDEFIKTTRPWQCVGELRPARMLLPKLADAFLEFCIRTGTEHCLKTYRTYRTYTTYFTLTILLMIFGSSGSKPDFGNRGVSVLQFGSIANTLRNSGSDSSTRPMFTKATACQ